MMDRDSSSCLQEALQVQAWKRFQIFSWSVWVLLASIGYSFNVHDGASYERVLRALGETLDRKLVLVSPDAVQVAEKLREQFPAITIVPVVLTFKAWVLASFSGIEQDENGHV
jgi:hypothetical protein